MNPRFKQRLLLFVFALFVSAITSLFLTIVLNGLINQYRALSFHPVRSTIDSIEQTSSSNRHGTTYGINISYHYNVNRQRYTAARIRYNQMSSGDRWSNHMLQQFPVHSHPTAYYDPANPAEAVLLPGPDGMDFFLLLFFTPFTLVMLALWSLFFFSFLPKSTPRNFNIYEIGSITRIRPTPLLPLTAGAAALGLSAFIAIFPLAFLSNDLHNSLHTVQIAGIICLSLAPLVAIITFLLRIRGYFDITFDETPQLLTTRQLRIPAAHLLHLYLTSNPTNQLNSQSFDLNLRYTQNNIPLTLILKRALPDPDTAARLSLYLALRLNIPALTTNDTPILPPAAASNA